MTSTISKKHAEQLWSRLHQVWLDGQAIIVEIIETQAWLPIGYATFTEAWEARMGDITLPVELRPYVVYQLLAEDAAPENVADLVKGVGPDQAETLAEQRDEGVPAGQADMSVVRRHLRRKPSERYSLHLNVGVENMREFMRIAALRKQTVEEIAVEAVTERFAELPVGLEPTA